MRKHYISVGAIVPDSPTKWESKRTTLRLDQAGREAAVQHIYEHEYNAFMGKETEFPLEQLPDCVRDYWGIV